MPDFLVSRTLPNPTGKDRTAGRASNEQLNREWVEFTNSTQRSLSLEGVVMSHYTFDRSCGKTGEDPLITFRGSLNSGSSIRLHTGSGTPWDEGAVRHLYVGRENYAWNNACGDTAVLRNSRGDVLDWAAYNAQPAEGVILNRVPGTNRLTAARAMQSA